MKYAFFALLSFLCLATLSPAMELPQASGTQAIIAEPTQKVSSLKKQAARSFCRAMHPDNRTLKPDLVLKLAAQAGGLNRDLKEKLSRNIAQENADVFEKINEDKPVCLTDRYINNYHLTKNTKKIWGNESDKYYNNALICIDIPSATETILDLNKTPYRIPPSKSYYIPNANGSILAMACVKDKQPDGLPPFLTLYNSWATKEEKKITEVMVLPTKNIQLKSFCNNQIVAHHDQPNNPQESRTYFIDCNQQKITTTLPAALLAVSKSGTHIATHNSAQKIMTLYKKDGTKIGTFPYHRYAPAFNIDETKMATTVNEYAYIWDINTQKLLHKIRYPVHHVIHELAFKDDHHIGGEGYLIAATHANVIQGVNKTYKTNLNTRHTRLLAESVARIRTNHDGNLNVRESADNKIVSLESTTHQKNLQTHHSPTKICIFGPGFTNNDEYLILTETGVNPISATELPWIKRYTTHRAITNTAPLEESLALCIAERQKNTGLAVDGTTQRILHNSQNQRIKEIAEKRYPLLTSRTIS